MKRQSRPSMPEIQHYVGMQLIKINGSTKSQGNIRSSSVHKELNRLNSLAMCYVTYVTGLLNTD